MLHEVSGCTSGRVPRYKRRKTLLKVGDIYRFVGLCDVEVWDLTSSLDRDRSVGVRWWWDLDVGWEAVGI